MIGFLLGCASAAVPHGESWPDKIKTKDAFLKVYRPYAERFADADASFHMRADLTHFRGKERVEEGVVEVFRRGEALRVDFYPVKETNDDRAHVRVVSPERSFKLTRGGKEKEFSITELSGQQLSNNYKEFEAGLRAKRAIVAPWYAYLETTVESWISRPDVKFENISFAESDANVLVAKFQRPDGSTGVVQYMQFEFLPERGWALAGYRMGLPDNYFKVDVEYSNNDVFPPEPVSLAKRRFDKKSDPKNDFSVERFQVTEFSNSKPSTSVFRLSHFGLGDDIGIGGVDSLWWLIGIVVVLFVCIVALVRWRQRI